MTAILRFLILVFAAVGAARAAPTVLIYGDSLSAGFGIDVAQAWPTLLAKRLAAEKPPATVVNASISGETTAGGSGRIEATLARVKPTVVVVALGANDGLRGLPLERTRDNLAAMVRAARAHKARVLLVGMRLPPNYGAAYTARFEAIFRDLAQQEKVALLPFLLEPIALDAGAYQPDRLHPTAAAQPRILDHVWTALRPLLKQS